VLHLHLTSQNHKLNFYNLTNLRFSGVFLCFQLEWYQYYIIFMASNLSALQRLQKAANLEPRKKEITLSDGSIFEMYVSPLTMAERDRAQRQSKDETGFALQLLLNKALDENGQRLFKAGEIDILKNEVKDSDLQSLMLAVINSEEDTIDPKN